MKPNYRHRSLGLFAACFALVLFGCTMPLQHGLTEEQANEVILLFSKENITASKMKHAEGREVTWTIEINKADAPKAIELLRKHNIPPRKEKGLADVYSQTGMIPTSTEEKAKFLMALSGEISQTLKRIYGVIEARVHIVMPEEKILKTPGEKQAEPTASILLITRAELLKFTRGEQQQRWIRQLAEDVKLIVKGSIENLKKTNVEVVVRPAAAAFSGEPGASADSGGYTNVLTLNVAPKDVMRLRVIMGGMLFLVVLFLGLFAWFFTRTASLKNQLKAMSSGGSF